MHETKRKRRGTGAPPAAGGALAGPRGVTDAYRPFPGLFAVVGVSMGKDGPRRSLRVGCQTTSGPQAEAFRRSVAGTGSVFEARGSGPRMDDGPVDGQAGGEAHPASLRCEVRSGPRQADVEKAAGLDLSETCTPGPGAGRDRDRALEAGRTAPYKKTPSVGVRTWFSPTNRASCSRPRYGAPWLHAVRHHCTTAGTGGTGYQPSAPSPSAPDASASTSTSTCFPTMKTFTPRTSWTSCAVSGGICLDPLRWPDDRFHTVVEGDRVDLLAHRYLGRADLWWVICDYNDISFRGTRPDAVGGLTRRLRASFARPVKSGFPTGP